MNRAFPRLRVWRSVAVEASMHPDSILFAMRIRTLKKSDIPEAVSIILENHEREYGPAARRELEEAFSKSAIRPRYVVAEDKGRVVGIAGYMQSWMDYDIYLIFWVNVMPSCQRQGIGKRMVGQAIKEIRKEKGARLILLSTASPAYYRKQFGFKTVQVFGKHRQHVMSLPIPSR
jgi:N-acetylglutamate synthase-like GNAT family acetyltransferase